MGGIESSPSNSWSERQDLLSFFGAKFPKCVHKKNKFEVLPSPVHLSAMAFNLYSHRVRKDIIIAVVAYGKPHVKNTPKRNSKKRETLWGLFS